jgi:hypothetical protein
MLSLIGVLKGGGASVEVWGVLLVVAGVVVVVVAVVAVMAVVMKLVVGDLDLVRIVCGI